MIPDSNKKPISELRFDLVSKNWVVIATGRAKRPEEFAKQEIVKIEVLEKDCPFCNLSTQGKPLLEYKNEQGQTEVNVVPNKYPEFSLAQIRKVIDAYHERYLELANEKFINYVSIFHNHGREAGASLVHPHSQIIAIPIIDPDLQGSLNGSRLFFDNQGECVHCKMIEWDMEDKRRIIFENKNFVVLTPFASRAAFEIRIYPKEHHPYFERIKDIEKDQLAQALQEALKRIFKGLNDPAYNFFLHTAPADGKDYGHYHWHFEILPKTAVWAGFELGAGIEISTVEPEAAAKYLREIE